MKGGFGLILNGGPRYHHLPVSAMNKPAILFIALQNVQWSELSMNIQIFWKFHEELRTYRVK